jgi:salicylate hydroxylase
MVAKQRDVSIVGAGIGGLAAALALHRQGVDVEVYEQATGLREVGVGMHLAANGSRILHRWGLGDRLDAVGVRPDALEVRDARDGHVLVRQPMGPAWTADFGAAFYTVNRFDLHRILADELPADRLCLGRSVVGVEPGAEGVTLKFADGGTVEAAVVVGADGAHSQVRRAVAGWQEPVFSGASAFRGLVPVTAAPGLSPGTMYLWSGGPQRMLCYPVDAGRHFTFVGIVPDQDWRSESWTTAGDPEELRAAFAGWPGEVAALLAAVTETRRWGLYDREPLDSWGIGRVTLLGDAAHPMLPHHGQGVSQALEDAVALAHFLGRAGADPEPALRDYEDLRRPHTTDIQLGSRGSGTMKLKTERTSRAMSSMVEDVSWIQRYDIAAELAQ